MPEGLSLAPLSATDIFLPPQPLPPIVGVFGGGSMSYTVIEALMRQPEDRVYPVSLCNVFDHGGDSGELRDIHGILPPGDMRRALVAHCVGEGSDTWRKIFNYRFPNKDPKLAGKVLGNLIHLACEDLWERPEAIRRLSRDILNIRGEVLPVSLVDADIVALLSDGTELEGEGTIDTRDPLDLRTIKKIWLKSKVPVTCHVPVLGVLERARMVVFAPGDLYTSLLPNLLVELVGPALRDKYVVAMPNLMTKPAETRGFTAFDFVDVPLQYDIGLTEVSVALVNVEPIPSELERIYTAKGSEPVRYNRAIKKKLLTRSRRVVERDLLDHEAFEYGLIRHDPTKVGQALMELLGEGR